MLRQPRTDKKQNGLRFARALFFLSILPRQLGRFSESLQAIEYVFCRRRGTADDFVLRAKIRWAVGMVRNVVEFPVF